MVRHQCVVGNYPDHRCQQDVVNLVAPQNLDEQNQVVDLTCQDAHQVRPLVFAVDAELRHQLKMDCYQDVVDAELMRHQLKMDCYLDVALQVLHLLNLPAQYFSRRQSVPELGR